MSKYFPLCRKYFEFCFARISSIIFFHIYICIYIFLFFVFSVYSFSFCPQRVYSFPSLFYLFIFIFSRFTLSPSPMRYGIDSAGLYESFQGFSYVSFYVCIYVSVNMHTTYDTWSYFVRFRPTGKSAKCIWNAAFVARCEYSDFVFYILDYSSYFVFYINDMNFCIK